MAKTRSISENRVFKKIYAKGRNVVSPVLVVYFMKNRLPFNRLGITVSKKVGKAVVRNRVRRRIKEVFRLHSDLLKEGYDFVLVGRGRTLTAPFEKLVSAFLNSVKDLKKE